MECCVNEKKKKKKNLYVYILNNFTFLPKENYTKIYLRGRFVYIYIYGERESTRPFFLSFFFFFFFFFFMLYVNESRSFVESLFFNSLIYDISDL